MTDILHLQPTAGLRVVDPATGKALPSHGAAVERCTYWERRLREGDVALVPAPVQTPHQPALKASSKKQ